MKVDNRWSAGGLDARVPETAKAAYGARWIDHDTWVDVVPDRQGFAYDDEADRSRLVSRMIEAKLEQMVAGLPYDEALRVVAQGVLDPDEKFYVWMRRAGGYVYVAAWIQ